MRCDIIWWNTFCQCQKRPQERFYGFENSELREFFKQIFIIFVVRLFTVFLNEETFPMKWSLKLQNSKSTLKQWILFVSFSLLLFSKKKKFLCEINITPKHWRELDTPCTSCISKVKHWEQCYKFEFCLSKCFFFC